MIIGLGMPHVGDVYGELESNHIMIGYDIGRHPDVEHLRMFDVQNVFPFDKARICLMDSAIRYECDYLLFVDADVQVPLGGFKALLKAIRDCKAQAVSGHYRRRGHPFTSVWTKQINDQTYAQVDASEGIHQICASGLGCCLIDVKWVKENMEEPYFDLGRKENGNYIWEDAYFFSKMKLHGGLLLGHAGVRCGHVMSTRKVVCDENWEDMLKDSTSIIVDGVDGYTENVSMKPCKDDCLVSEK